MAWHGKRSDEFCLKLRAALNRPEVREKRRAALKQYYADPEVREKRRAALKQYYADPEVREKRRAAAIEARLGWCPVALREDYRTLSKALGAAAARESIEAQIARRVA